MRLFALLGVVVLALALTQQPPFRSGRTDSRIASDGGVVASAEEDLEVEENLDLLEHLDESENLDLLIEMSRGG